MPQSKSEPDREQQLLAALASMRTAADHQCDPVAFHYMELLAKRIPTQPDAVRRILVNKLHIALSRYGEKLSQARCVPQVPASSPSQVAPGNRPMTTRANDVAATAPACLSELNHYLEILTKSSVEDGLMAEAQDRSEMKSVRQFKQAWSRIRAEDQVDRAVLRGPKNPGPINSHMLVLRTLKLMRHLSPAYLQRFVSQADAWLCLDRVALKPSSMATKPSRRGRAKK